MTKFYRGFAITEIGGQFEVINLETGKRLWRRTMRHAKWTVSVYCNIKEQVV